jgi:PAS domain S-box-containing protein
MATLFQALIRNSFDVIKVVDRDFRTIFVSPSVERVLGHQPRDLLGTNPLDFVHPDDVQQATEFLQRIARDGETNRTTVRARHRDGSWRNVDVIVQDLREDTDVGGFVMNYRDVTERVQAERRVRAFQERYEKAFRSCPDSITITSGDTGEFMEANEGFERITGYARSEVIGRKSLDMGMWRDPARRDDLNRQLAASGSVRDFAAEVVVRDGSIRSCLVSAERIEIGGRNCILAVARDVTREREREAQLRELSETLRRDQVEFVRKNVALNEVLQHIEVEKQGYRHEIAANVDNLLRPMLRKLSDLGRLERRDIEFLQRSLDEVTGRHIDQYRNNVSKLTPRELDILEMIRVGRSSKQIADALGLSSQTIHKHRQSIRRKLQIDHREINLATFLRSR